VNSQPLHTQRASIGNDPGFLTTNEERTAIEGLEDLFKWASDMVATSEDPRVKIARENRIRRQVLEVVQQLREKQAVEQSKDEISYLQRRVIALLQKLQETTQENGVIKQIMVAQCFALQRIPELEKEIELLRSMELEGKPAEEERETLLTALSKLKVDRDFLDELLHSSEEENTRLARLLAEARAEVDRLTSRRWWHWFFPAKN